MGWIRRNLLSRQMKKSFDSYFSERKPSRDALAAKSEMNQIFLPLAYRSQYQIVSRCPQLTALFAWMQAYLEPHGTRSDDRITADIFLACIIEYWLNGTADPRLVAYLSPAQRKANEFSKKSASGLVNMLTAGTQAQE